MHNPATPKVLSAVLLAQHVNRVVQIMNIPDGRLVKYLIVTGGAFHMNVAVVQAIIIFTVRPPYIELIGQLAAGLAKQRPAHIFQLMRRYDHQEHPFPII